MTQMLASVTGAAEAAIAIRAGADIVDLKDPTSGSLGALPLPVLQETVAAHSGRRPLSATTGDLPPDPDTVLTAARGVAATGVDYVKVGLFGAAGDIAPRLRTIEALRALAQEGVALVAVLMADTAPDFELLPSLGRTGFTGVVLDTQRKPSRHSREVGAPTGLRTALSDAELAAFVMTAREHGLLVGLAGSLTVADIAPLLALGPDILGFRGALCDGGRDSSLCAQRVAAIRRAIPPRDGVFFERLGMIGQATVPSGVV